MAILQAKTEGGMVEGLPGWNQAVTLFRGIPYAAPPVGENRWKDPQPVIPWEGVFKAYNFGNICYQDRRPSEGGNDIIGQEFYCLDWPRDEDCLYLNVTTPAKSVDEKLPVCVYFHGGGYSQGYGHLNCYDGEGFAKRGVIYVSINHRLGPFGFLAHPELTAESPHHSSGNYGLIDLVAALKWIRNNIANFGGDPDKISIFGQSGGGNKVMSMVVTPLTNGMLKGAIMQSGGGLNRGCGKTPTQAENEQKGVEFFEALGVKTLAEARAKSQEEIMDAVHKMSGNPMGLFNANIDGYLFPEDWNDMIVKGDYEDINLMIGCTAEEFLMPNAKAGTREEVIADGERRFGPGKGEEFLAAMKYDTDKDYADLMYQTIANMTGETFAGDRAWVEMQTANGKKPMYQYFLTIVPPGADNAHHSAEHQYVFQTLLRSSRPYAGPDYDLSNQLASYWANFFKNGDPNGEGLPEWTPYCAENRKALEINYGPHMIDEPRTDNEVINMMVERDKTIGM